MRKRSAATVAALVAAAIGVGRSLWPRVEIPAHMRHDAILLPELIAAPDFAALRRLVQRFGADGYALNTNDVKWYTTEHEHIGEAEPMPPSGRCDNVFMVPSVNRSLCILPGRIDIGKHYVMSGGIEGLKEGASSLTARALSFGRYIFDLDAHPEVRGLFEGERFQAAAMGICPPAKRHLDPFQFNFILQLPGQSVPMHIDGAYFWGATRFQFPQWLLAVMVWSGLFADRFVDQVQVVGYLHDAYDARSSGGEFVWWGADGAPGRVAPQPRFGSAIDGSKTVHAAAAYRADERAPPIDKSVETELVYVGGEGEMWELRAATGEGGAMATIGSYPHSRLRISIVYRARCFASEAEAAAFRELQRAPEEAAGRMRLEEVLGTLRADLAARGVATDGLPPYALAMALLRNYVRYPPPPDAWSPWNWCALGGLAPWAKPALRWVCASV